MSVADEITRLQGLRSDQRAVLTGWGVTIDPAADYEEITTALQGITDNGTINGTIDTKAEQFPIPAGYHDGSGTVQILAAEQAKIIADNIKSGVTILGVAGNYAGESVNLQQKTVTPTKSTQTVQPDSGFDGLSEVTVNAIPANYQDVAATTATAPDVLATKIFTTAAGVVTTGTMVNNGAVAATFDGLTPATSSYTIPAGYHSGTGTVSLTNDIETQLAAL